MSQLKKNYKIGKNIHVALNKDFVKKVNYHDGSIFIDFIDGSHYSIEGVELELFESLCTMLGFIYINRPDNDVK